MAFGAKGALGTALKGTKTLRFLPSEEEELWLLVEAGLLEASSSLLPCSIVRAWL